MIKNVFELHEFSLLIVIISSIILCYIYFINIAKVVKATIELSFSNKIFAKPNIYKNNLIYINNNLKP